ncbi:diguanylate cyclase domain-containing protein [Leptolyngbya sp. AN02str]|uniref:diguanylate cyclase domain-containing protein n=1 Tax=Leptolyngbya sp. AN02str TaxID=3423363 RepID=UPI003D31F47F
MRLQHGCSIRWLWTVAAVLQLLGTAGVLGYWADRYERHTVPHFSHQLIDETSLRIATKLESYLAIAHLMGQLIEQDVADGRLNLENMRQVEQHLWSRMQTFGSVSSLSIGQSQGNLRAVTRLGHLQLLKIDAPKTNQIQHYSLSANGSPQQLQDITTTLPVSQVAWYQKAIATQHPTWSPITPALGYTTLSMYASRPLIDPVTQELQGVVAVGIELELLNHLLAAMKTSTVGTIFLVEPNGLIVASSTTTPTFTATLANGKLQYKRIAAVDSRDDSVRTISRFLANHHEGFQNIEQGTLHRVHTPEGIQLIHVQPFQDQYGLRWRLVTALSETGIAAMGTAQWPVGLSILVLLVPLSVGVLATQWKRRFITQLSRATRLALQGEMDVRVEVPPQRDLGNVAEAFNQLMHQLQEQRQRLEQVDRLPNAQRFHNLVQNLDVGVLVHQAHSSEVLSNPAALRLLGLTEAQLAGTVAFDPQWAMLREDGSPLPDEEHPVAIALATGEPRRNVVMGVINPFRQAHVWLSVNAEPQYDAEGHVLQVVCTFSDISDLKHVESALRLKIEREQTLNRVIQVIHNSLNLKDIFSTAAQEVVELLRADAVAIVQYVNTRDRWVTVHTHGRRARGARAHEFQFTDQGNPLSQRLRQLETIQITEPETLADTIHHRLVRAFPGPWLLVPIHYGEQSGERIWGCLCLLRVQAAHQWNEDECGLAEVIAAQLAIAIQQSELYQRLEAANQQLEHLATIDGLTQVANRRRFDDYLQQEWLRLAREQRSLSLILCDVDHFKAYNDTYGHQAGDVCLIRIAQTISKTVARPADLLARYGGEEFVIVLPNTSTTGAVHVVEKIQQAMRSLSILHASSPIQPYVTLSLGVATTLPNSNLSPQLLIEVADHALYQAKSQGRDRYAVLSL